MSETFDDLFFAGGCSVLKYGRRYFLLIIKIFDKLLNDAIVSYYHKYYKLMILHNYGDIIYHNISCLVIHT